MNFVSRAPAKNYLTLPCGASEERIARTHEMPLAQTKIIIRAAPDRAPAGDQSLSPASGPHTASTTHSLACIIQ